jgi:predicted SAM-dependent methyltransferase
MKINLGCGNDIQRGYINIDTRSIEGVDLICNIEDLPYTNNTIDEIRAIDVIEHIPWAKQQELFKYYYSLLKKGGFLRVQVPDLDNILNMRNKVHDIKIIRWLFGGQDYQSNFHYTVFTKKWIKELLENAGFKNIDIKDLNTNIVVKAYK